MLVLKRGQKANFKFIFVSENKLYDPTTLNPKIDIYFSLTRGDNGAGPIIDGPFSYLNQPATPSGKVQIYKTNKYEFNLDYTIPDNLFPGTYSILAQTKNTLVNLNIVSSFQVINDPITLSPTIASSEKSAYITYKASYEDLNRSNTNTILLIGHADNVDLNVPIKIRSIQSAIDILGTSTDCPLLRGVYNAYAAGARDIFICAAAPMVEYIASPSDRLVSTTMFNLSAATPSSYTFYQKYYERLQTTYSLIKDMDFVDYVVPLEASIIKTGGVDFVTQLANYLSSFHNTTGFVQMGVIGSRSDGLSSDDVTEIKANTVLKNKLTTYNSNGTIASDIGRFIIPIYGEGVYQHTQLNTGYSSSLEASLAGLLASAPLNMGLIRTRIPGVASVFGSDLNQSDLGTLDAMGINTIYRGKKARRSIPFEVYISNEYTLANLNSTLSKAAQMRLVARLVSQIRSYGYEAIGKMGYDNVISNVRNLLSSLKKDNVIIDYTFNTEVSSSIVGKLTFYIEIISSLGLKKINFAIATGPEA